jgi:hypothetical protein
MLTAVEEVKNKYNQASLKTHGIGKRILKIVPTTMAGLLVRVRVIETYGEEILGGDANAADLLAADIRDFAKHNPFRDETIEASTEAMG